MWGRWYSLVILFYYASSLCRNPRLFISSFIYISYYDIYTKFSLSFPSPSSLFSPPLPCPTLFPQSRQGPPPLSVICVYPQRPQCGGRGVWLWDLRVLVRLLCLYKCLCHAYNTLPSVCCWRWYWGTVAQNIVVWVFCRKNKCREEKKGVLLWYKRNRGTRDCGVGMLEGPQRRGVMINL